ncbi:nucleotide exchange factor GrpE [Streptomyces sp. NPDC046876]|uniref:nucleotide exchange factor GrpE n=1 Tax=Streptomyces sp. NPDC046876 TaxID=3155616 RepID=UPI0033FB355C
MSHERPERTRPAEDRAGEEAVGSGTTQAASRAEDAAAAAATPHTPAEVPEGSEPSDSDRPSSTDRPAAGREAPVLPELDVEDLRDRWQRAVAETENLRKRYERQMDEVRRAEQDRVTAAWLPVVDHLELALQHAAADPKAVIPGVEAVCQQAHALLAQLGYRRIADIGEPFDPAVHEAAQVREEPGAAPGNVVQVLRAGYDSDRGLLRPAVVSVAAKPQE